MTLRELRKAGVNTRFIKSAHSKLRTVPKKDSTETHEERSIELVDNQAALRDLLKVLSRLPVVEPEDALAAGLGEAAEERLEAFFAQMVETMTTTPLVPGGATPCRSGWASRSPRAGWWTC